MEIYFSGNNILLPASLKGDDWVNTFDTICKYIAKEKNIYFTINCQKLNRIDTAGIAALDELYLFSEKLQKNFSLSEVSPNVKESISIFSSFPNELLSGPENSHSKNFTFFSPQKNLVQKETNFEPLAVQGPVSFFLTFTEKIGEQAIHVFSTIQSFIDLLAEIAYWSIHDIFISNNRLKGSIIAQGVYVGANALAIVALMTFLVGLVLGLQSAAQLRQFGANIFIVHLIGISMTREMGPLMTAILLAGRSGSAFAAEIATMKVSEELDALHVMALNPIRFVVVPKVYAISMSAPLLTIIADVVGIFGGFIIAVLYLDLTPYTFFQELIKILIFKDILTSLVKSIVFAWIIVAIGSFFGFKAKGGPEGVGLVTTQSVVASIFGVIIADSILGLLFYF